LFSLEATADNGYILAMNLLKTHLMRAGKTLLIVPFAVLLSFSQELECDVTVNLEKLPSAARDYLVDVKSDIERYMNSTRFTDEDLSGERIRVSMNIFFESMTGENRYLARVFVGSVRPVYVGDNKSGRTTPVVRVLDERWEFGYVPNQPMVHDPFRFDPLTSFLDFYAFLVIGFDLETYLELSGSRSFQKAFNIANQAASAGSRDWQQSQTYSRFNIIDEIMNNKFQPFRLAFFSYHFEGTDLLGTQNMVGLNNMLAAIEAISDLRQKQDPRSVLIRAFFEAKYQEIAEMFLQYPDRTVYNRLSAADPAHQSTYQEYSTR
jgi:hypothetical protein